jgi:hypothetical protein
MDEFIVRKATRSQVNLLMALISPSGGGKTYSALRIARGLVGPEGRIVLIDTENRRSEIYADEFAFDIVEFDPPFPPERYIAVLDVVEATKPDCIIVDSTSHEWAGKGGVMELVDKVQATSKAGKFAGWAELTPRHNSFLDRLIRCSTHLIVCLRGKDEYVLEDNDRGKKDVRKIGVGPQQRPGIEYEFYVSLLIDQDTHYAHPMKDNSHLFEHRLDILTEKDGQRLAAWCANGVNPVQKARPDYQALDALLVAHAEKIGEEKLSETRKAMLLHNADVPWLRFTAQKIEKAHGPAPTGDPVKPVPVEAEKAPAEVREGAPSDKQAAVDPKDTPEPEPGEPEPPAEEEGEPDQNVPPPQPPANGKKRPQDQQEVFDEIIALTQARVTSDGERISIRNRIHDAKTVEALVRIKEDLAQKKTPEERMVSLAKEIGTLSQDLPTAGEYAKRCLAAKTPDDMYAIYRELMDKVAAPRGGSTRERDMQKLADIKAKAEAGTAKEKRECVGARQGALIPDAGEYGD